MRTSVSQLSVVLRTCLIIASPATKCDSIRVGVNKGRRKLNRALAQGMHSKKEQFPSANGNKPQDKPAFMPDIFTVLLVTRLATWTKKTKKKKRRKKKSSVTR